MDNLYSITGFQWFVIFAVSFIWGSLGFYLSGNDLNHRLKLFGLFSVGFLVAFIVLKFFGQI